MSINWFPGHMSKATREIREMLPKVDLVIEIVDARLPYSSANPVLAALRAGKPCLKLLSKADLADPEGVAAMFTNGIYGVYASVDKVYRNATSTTNPGSLGGSISRYTKQLQQVGEDKTELVEKQETLRASLASRFSKSEARIGQLNSTMSFLENQIAAWNKSD